MLLVRNYTIVSNFVSMLLSFFFLLMLVQKAYGENVPPLNPQHESVPQDLVTASIDELLPEGVLMTQSLVNSPMPKLKNSKLGKILTRHYNKCLGGADHWKTIKSVKISADLDSLTGFYEYESVTKNPNLYKISLSLDGQTRIFAFDGTDIRQKQISEEGITTPIKAGNLKRTINGTQLPRYLLYPLQAGKAYQYLGTVREFNTVCYKLRLFTDQNFVIDYFLDVESCCIVTIKVIDRLEEFSPVLIRYFDYRLIDGIYLAHKIESFINEQWDSTLKVNSAITNAGTASWMFDLK